MMPGQDVLSRALHEHVGLLGGLLSEVIHPQQGTETCALEEGIHTLGKRCDRARALPASN